MTVQTISVAHDRPAMGVAMMLSGIGCFAVMDALIKWLVGDYPVPQVVALRSWFGFPLLCLLVHFEGGFKAARTRRPGAHVARYVLVLLLSFSFFWALSRLKLVDAIAITFAAPILISALSVPLLKEVVGVRRWLAILIGFGGVLIMLRPGAGVFQWAALAALGSALFYALLMITTRALKSTETTAALLLYPQVGMCITGVIVAPYYWIAPGLADLGLFALAGAFGSIGILCITHAFRLAPASVVSPFEYSALIWGTILGFLLWGELPDAITIWGAAVVAMSGIYIIYREAINKRRVKARSPGRPPHDTVQ